MLETQYLSFFNLFYLVWFEIEFTYLINSIINLHIFSSQYMRKCEGVYYTVHIWFNKHLSFSEDTMCTVGCMGNSQTYSKNTHLFIWLQCNLIFKIFIHHIYIYNT